MPAIPAGIVGASPLNANDGSYYTFPTDAEHVQAFQFSDMPADFASMDSLNINIDRSLVTARSDDTYTLWARVMDGTTVLAGQTAVNDATSWRNLGTVTSTTDALTNAQSFAYVSTAANKTAWNDATVELRQTYTQSMGKDGTSIRVDYVVFTGVYTATVPRPTVSTVGTDNTVRDKEAGITVTGTQFGTQGANSKVEITNSVTFASPVNQTVGTWSDTSITITGNLGINSPGTRYLWVTRHDNGLRNTTGFAITMRRAKAFRLADSTHIAAGAATATTPQLTPPAGKNTGQHTAGRISDDTNPLPSIDIGNDGYTELEWSITPITADVGPTSTVYQWRVVAGTSNLASYTTTPTWTIGTGVTTVNGTGVGTASAAGSATGIVTRYGTGIGAAVAAGSATGEVTRYGTGTGTASAAGSATGATIAAGTGSGTASGSGTAAGHAIVEAAGVGTASGSGTATGQVTVTGTGIASSAAAGIATGAVTVVGSAASTAICSGAATGTVIRHGTAVGSASATGSASGLSGTSGTAVGSAAATGSASGIAGTSGTGVGTATATGSAAGQATVGGTAVGSAATSGAASGEVTVHGSGTGTATGTGTASGEAVVHATATGTANSTGAASGVVTVHASATGSAVAASGAAGEVTTTGTGSGTATAGGTATGTVTVYGTATGGASSSGSAVGVVPGSFPRDVDDPGVRWVEQQPAHVGPYLDTNGNLYFVAEGPTTSNTETTFYKSTDRGLTWTQAGSSGSSDDMEAYWSTRIPGRTGEIASIVLRGGNTPRFYRFGLSDHPTNADAFIAPMVSITNTGHSAIQALSCTPWNTIDILATYSSDDSGEARIMGCTWDSTVNDWRTPFVIDDTANEWATMAVTTVAADGTAHILYTTHDDPPGTGGELWHRTYSTGGVLSGRQKVNTNGVGVFNDDPHGSIAGAHHHNGTLHVVWHDGSAPKTSGFLFHNTIADGQAPGATPTQVTTRACSADYTSGATIDGPNAATVADGSEIYVLFGDATTHNLWSIKWDGSSWVDETEQLANVDLMHVSASVLEWAPNDRVLGIMFEDAEGGTPAEGAAKYHEIGLPSITSGTAVGSAATSGAASGTVTVSVAAAGTASASGSAAGAVTVHATGAGSASATGTAAGHQTIAGTAAGTASGTGFASATVTVAGSATGSAAATGTGTGSAAASGSATGSAAASGTGTGFAIGSGSATAAASATGSAVGVAIVAGTASGAAAASGTATGTAGTAGTGTASASASGAANGAAVVHGTGTGSASATGTATGTGQAAGTATGSASASGTATGAAVVAATGTGSASATGTASGTAETAGTGTGSAAATGTAAGHVTVHAVCTGTATTGGTCTGHATVHATGAGTASAAGTAVGPRRYARPLTGFREPSTRHTRSEPAFRHGHREPDSVHGHREPRT